MDRNLNMVWWRWHISVTQLCCCWSMAVSFWVAPTILWMCFGVLHHDNTPVHTTLSTGEFLASKQYNCAEEPSLFAGFRPQWLFSVPKNKGNIERKAFWWHWWYQDYYDGSSEGHYTKSVLKLFWRVAQALASVRSFTRGVTGRQPQWYSAVRYVALLPQ
jgi:hypothetical protein